MTKSKLLIVAAILFVIGLGLMIMPSPGEPELQCAPEGGPTSGFASEEKNCPTSIESYNEYAEWASRPKYDNIAGILLVLASGGVAVAALVKGRRDKKAITRTPIG